MPQKRRFLIIADPVEKLNPTADTGLGMYREGLSRGHEMFWTHDNDLQLIDGKVWTTAHSCQSCEQDQRPTFTDQQFLSLDEFNGIWIRKDPPFNESYVNLCWFLSLHSHRVPMINPPEKLLLFHEKLIPFLAFSQGVLKEDEILPTWITEKNGSATSPPAWVNQSAIISKPWRGHGGREVKKWPSYQEFLANTSDIADLMIQPFLEEVSTLGDRRVFILDGKLEGEFVRMPAKGGFISNLAQGGSAQNFPMTDRAIEVSEKIGLWLKQNGILFAGLDVIDHRISEVNITAPTGFSNLVELGGENLFTTYLEIAERMADQ